MIQRIIKGLPTGTFQYSETCVWLSIRCFRYSTSIILRVAYGRSTPTSIDDPAFVGVKEVIDHFNEAMRPGAYLVDRFHWLKHVPGYGRRLKEYHDSDSKFYNEQLGRVKCEMVRSILLDDSP